MADETTSPEVKHDPRGLGINDAREGLPTGEMHEQSPEEKKAQDRRNIAIALAVVAFAALVFATTILRLAENLNSAGAS
ncbi:protoheme IX farnesyltransferase [Parvularcula lutaonensis]|uniref:Protoheme IX farnesyltransferase n=1 Tax=Parvularcula lutaonensis TaxID=491923 RepID=A0ABV7MDG7_9PROT|nr:protoheme IX farnesyltransferase [Parvularcula lutaonensis]GGY53066.1 hypothetical protein GCM10007148_22870 [Parvularcula lutaonensis]